VEAEDEDDRRARVVPDEERRADQNGGQRTGLDAAVREWIAVGEEDAALDPQPAARQQVELIAAGLGPSGEEQHEGEPDDEPDASQRIGGAVLGAHAQSIATTLPVPKKGRPRPRARPGCGV
jgi:hypothetical protein